MAFCIHIPSPLGELTAAATEDALIALTIAGQRYEREHLPAACVEEETALLRRTRLWLEEYFAGARPAPDALPLAPAGTGFQKRVWRALCAIPYGETRSYGALAALLASSPRAVGAAVGRNPISILIPCHRVLGADGGLTGYAGGLENKRRLLRLEGAIR